MRELDRLKTSHNEVKVKQKNKHPDIKWYCNKKILHFTEESKEN
jgi:hypothetical protein